jgi:ketosteroid isomerase-like protein
MALMMDVVVAVQSEWVDAFRLRDIDRLAALYTDMPSFYGSKPHLLTTRAGIRHYFETLSPAYIAAEYGKMNLVRLGLDGVIASGRIVFKMAVVLDASSLRMYRITQVLVRVGADWRIAAHHASPEPEG